MTRSHELRAEGIRLSYGGRTVVHDLDVAVPPGRTTVIVGPNACGKSTLLKGLARLLRPDAGRVLLDGRDLRTIPTKQLARSVGLLPQHPVAPDGITVADLVGRGRYPHQGMFSRWSAEDDAAVTRALEQTSVLELGSRRIEELSGGQRQRVWIAMALAQEPDILLLDEPTTFLDLSHQVEVLDVLHDLNRARGTTVVMVLHDLNLAGRYADHVVVMSGGAIVREGAPRDVITPDTVRSAFGMESLVVPDPVTNSPMVVPFGRFHRLMS
ncbi:ABC transporter ATP-binding protein [soil metagenome]